jgi:outer membrane protein insertion porin family
MTSDKRSIQPVPRKVPAGRIRMTGVHLAAPASCAGGAAAGPNRAALKLVLFSCAAALLAVVFEPSSTLAQLEKTTGTIAKIGFEGNATITPEQIKPKLLSRVGEPLSQDKLEADLKSLIGTNWFSNATYHLEETPPKSGKYTLIFTVREMTLLKSVEFRGRTAIRLKEIEDTTELKAGKRADPTRTRLAVGQIHRLYTEKGYDLVSVTLLEGGNYGDTKIVIEIFEGPKVKVGSINFVGNHFASAPTLRTHIVTRKPILGLFGKYDHDMLDDDRQKLIDYYYANGFFEVKVTPVTRPGDDMGKVDLTFVISEGTQYRVRNVMIEGNSKIKTDVLRSDLELHSGKPFMMAVRDADKNRMLLKYGEIGCIDAQIECEPRFTNQLGIVDLVYRIAEREPYKLGELRIIGNDRTRDKVIRREAVMAGLLPGEILDKNRVEIFRRRLMSLGYFMVDPQHGKNIKIDIVDKRSNSQPYAEVATQLPLESTQARMQDPGPGAEVAQAPGAAPPAIVPGLPAPPPAPGLMPFSSESPFEPQPNVPPVEVPAPTPVSPGLVPVRPINPPPPPIGTNEPPASFPSLPGMNMTDVGPDRNDSFPNRAFADIVTSVEEAPTGRFMIGVGANSFQGLIGNISIYEKNFDIFNFPRSFSDIVNGQAFRGGGQSLQINLQAGNLINMVMVSLREPYLFDLPLAGSASGFVFSRVYPNWNERRGGGSWSLGRVIGTSIYADMAVRAEEVDFFGYRSPAPANYLAASGFTSLVSIKPSIRFDNRNNPFMATKGQYLQLSSEQGFGSFTWTKFDAEGRVYLPTGSRPDGTGQRFFTLRGHYGVATESTPVYERYFAGNFASLRGFQYRTVSPHVFNVPIGGVMMAVGSVEYQVPWNARDTFFQTFFTDFGTVTGNYEFSQMRISVGTGLKVLIRAMSQIPFEFDLAFPVLKAPGDKVQYFNFSVGGVW